MTETSLISSHRELFESYLEKQLIGEDLPQKLIYDAMRYSLLAGGKRIRPILVMEFCRMSGGDPENALPYAAALEMIHTYSLIHDDLPCMDDDDLRRGRPTNHKVYGEATAVLAGDALLTAAFEHMLSLNAVSSLRDPMTAVRCAHFVAERAGAAGMVGGQVLDIAAENAVMLNQEQLMEIHVRKTGALIEAACILGVLLAESPEEPVLLEKAGRYASNLGLAFQIKDDILDASSSEDVLGKSVGSDEKSGKSTFYSLCGKDRCERMVEELTDNAVSAIADITGSEALVALAWQLCGREK